MASAAPLHFKTALKEMRFIISVVIWKQGIKISPTLFNWISLLLNFVEFGGSHNLHSGIFLPLTVVHLPLRRTLAPPSFRRVGCALLEKHHDIFTKWMMPGRSSKTGVTVNHPWRWLITHINEWQSGVQLCNKWYVVLLISYCLHWDDYYWFVVLHPARSSQTQCPCMFPFPVIRNAS